MRPDEIPSIEQSVLSPTELPFTQDDFDPQLQDALELMPEILGDEKVGIRYAINGLISMTPDGFPVLGETPEVKGLWSVAASWIKEGPGIGTGGGGVMSGGCPRDRHPRGRHRPLLRPPADPGRTSRAGSRGLQQDVRDRAPLRAVGVAARPTRLSPVYAQERELGAVFFETAGWERPFWYESNEPLLETVRRAA